MIVNRSPKIKVLFALLDSVFDPLNNLNNFDEVKQEEEECANTSNIKSTQITNFFQDEEMDLFKKKKKKKKKQKKHEKALSNNQSFISLVISDFDRPVKRSRYICDKYFHVDPALELYNSDMNSSKKYGITIILGEEVKTYLLENNESKLINKETILRQKRQNNGGQSQARISRLRLGQINKWTKRICEIMKKSYIDKHNQPIIQGLFICGNGFMKDKVYTSQFFHNDLYSRTVCVYPISTNEPHYQIINIAKEFFFSQDQQESKRIMNTFISNIEKRTNLVTYGVEETLRCTKNGQMKEIIIEKDKFTNYDYSKVTQLCNLYQTTVKIIYHHKLNDYGGMIGFLRYKLN
jgi:peptide subunit release factor 1 (eRF1)